MAVVNIHAYPFAMMVEDLITKANCFPGGISQARDEYVQKAFNFTHQEREKGAKEYLRSTLVFLYGTEEEAIKARRSDIARLALIGEYSPVKLQPDERLVVVIQLLEAYRKKYGDIPFGEL